MDRIGFGIIGCGNISAAYLRAARHFPVLDLKGVADLNAEAARARASEFGTRAMKVEELLADPDVEIVVNLTIPKAHAEVSLRILDAGKHVHSEKPLGVTFAEGQRIVAAAEAAGLRVGCAPDTFLGGAHQACRTLVDEGAIGTPVGGTAFFMNPGHERWHPAPAFYYEAGGGPVLDMGPYYLTALVNLLGPVAAVSAMTAMPRLDREITSEPLKGSRIPVHVPTHAAATLRFEAGAVVQMTMSFDVPAHRHLPIEVYGTTGTLIVPDPNHFGGEIELIATGGEWGRIDWSNAWGDDNYRVIGAADMARGILEDRPHRASGALALHVLEVMEAIGTASETARTVDIETRPERPAPLTDPL